MEGFSVDHIHGGGVILGDRLMACACGSRCLSNIC